MKKLFVILLNYIVPLDVIDSYRADHLKFLDRYYEKGVFIISGPQNPEQQDQSEVWMLKQQK